MTLFEHPPYIPALAPSDCHLFLHLKKCSTDQCLRSDQQTVQAVQNWLKVLAATFLDELVQRYEKRLNFHGECMER